jgi:hypothetical protein
VLADEKKVQEGQLTDLAEGTVVSLKLSVADRQKVLGVQVTGPSVSGTLKGVDAGNHQITITVKEDGNKVDKTFVMAKDGRVRTADKSAKGVKLTDLTEGTKVVLQLSVFDRKTVIAVGTQQDGEE